MKTLVSFRSRKFPPYPGEEEQINPGLWGRRLAEYLAERLPAHGVEPGAMNNEDWGWYLPVNVQGTLLALCCGHQDGEDDEFVIFTDPARPVYRRLFRKVDLRRELEKLVVVLATVLEVDPEITDLEWQEPGP